MGIQSDIAGLAELKRLADACPPPGNHNIESGEWKSVVAFRDEVVRVFGCDIGMAKALIAEIERLRTAEGDAMTYKAGMENVAQQRDQLKAENEALRKDSDRYRWFRDHSLQIVCASTGPWVHNLDKVIDEAMAARRKGAQS